MFARQAQETSKVREVLMVQELLHRLKEDGVRNDFLKQRNGACSVDKDELAFIDKFAQLVVPRRPSFSNEPSFSSAAKASADHFSFLIDGRSRVFLDTGFTYEKAKELFGRIQSCGYWEKDVKIVEVVEESRAENDTPNTEDLEAKDEEKSHAVSAPAPAQVPTPTFNGNVNAMPVQQQRMQQASMARLAQQQAPLPAPTNVRQTTVTAVENAYFNQMKYSQPQGPQQLQQMHQNGMPVAPSQNDFGGTNFSFLQDSELDSPAAPGSQQHKMPVNVIQPKHSPMQQVQPATYKNANFHPQSPIAAGQMTYPPGLKVQQPAPHIPVNYQATSQQLNQQASQVQSHMIPKQQQPPVNGFGAQTPPMTQQQQTSRPAYPTLVPKAQYQQQLPTSNASNLASAKPMEPKPAMDGSGDALLRPGDGVKEDYQQQPQIDTWTNETAAQAGGNYTSRSSGGFSRNRSSGAAGGTKFNNYR